MAAGLGFKDFTTGEVLTAADVDGYLMQGVWVFASAAARDAAVTSPQEGNFAYLKDTNVTTYYTGSAWANLDTTGMTNPMTTTGDMIYSSSGSTPARLGIGTAGQVLKVNSGATAPEWAAASSGSMTLLSTTSLSGAIVTLSTINQTYQHLYLVIDKFTNLTSNGQLIIKPNASANVQMAGQRVNGGNAAVDIQTNTAVNCGWNTNRTNADNTAGLFIYDYATSTRWKRLSYINGGVDGAGGNSAAYQQGVITADTAISSITIESNGGDLNGGTAYLYGVN
jgi:hypothetical protein